MATTARTKTTGVLFTIAVIAAIANIYGIITVPWWQICLIPFLDFIMAMAILTVLLLVIGSIGMLAAIIGSVFFIIEFLTGTFLPPRRKHKN